MCEETNPIKMYNTKGLTLEETLTLVENLTSAKDLTPAERFYLNHKKRVSDYQKANPEKMREKCKKYNQKLKEEQPEKYEQLLEKKRKYYLEVRKPKLEALKYK
jgi:hypothetical protein